MIVLVEVTMSAAELYAKCHKPSLMKSDLSYTKKKTFLHFTHFCLNRPYVCVSSFYSRFQRMPLSCFVRYVKAISSVPTLEV